MNNKSLFQVKMYPQGIYLSPSQPLNTGNPTPVKRKKISVLTDSVRRRIAWNYQNGPWVSMITLTYHSGTVVPYDESKKALDSFLKALRDRDVVYMWVLEFQRRGVPHYHIWMNKRFKDCPSWEDDYGPESWRPLVKRWLKSSKQSEDESAVKCQLHQSIYTDWQVLEHVNYGAKYAQKIIQKGLPVGLNFYGKWWGITRGLDLQEDGYLMTNDEYYRSNPKDVEEDIKKFNTYRRQQIKLISNVQNVNNPQKFHHGLKRLISKKTRLSSQRLFDYYLTDRTLQEAPF